MLIAIANRFGVTHHLGAMIVTTVSSGTAVPPISYCLFVGMANSKMHAGAQRAGHPGVDCGQNVADTCAW